MSAVIQKRRFSIFLIIAHKGQLFDILPVMITKAKTKKGVILSYEFGHTYLADSSGSVWCPGV